MLPTHCDLLQPSSPFHHLNKRSNWCYNRILKSVYHKIQLILIIFFSKGPEDLTMTEPVLEYKKPNSQHLEPAGPEITQPASRKVLERRKALQQFYKIANTQGNAGATGSKDSSITGENKVNSETTNINANRKRFDSISSVEGRILETVDALEDPEKMKEFINNSPIEEILKIRNFITNNLNSHEAEKKSIIYDNYYELIRLSQVLHGFLHASMLQIKSEGGSETLGKKREIIQEITDEYVGNLFNSLLDFIGSTASLTAPKFEDIAVENILDDDQTSVRTIVEVPEAKTPESISKLESEVWTLLHMSKLEEDDRSKLESSVKELIQAAKNPLLAQQLQAILNGN